MKKYSVIIATLITFALSISFFTLPLAFAQTTTDTVSRNVQASSDNAPLSSSERLVRDLAQILGPTGFLGWFCWYVVTKTLPDKDTQQISQQNAFMAALKEDREAADKKLDKILAEGRLTVDKLVESINKHIDTVLVTIKHCPNIQSHEET